MTTKKEKKECKKLQAAKYLSMLFLYQRQVVVYATAKNLIAKSVTVNASTLEMNAPLNANASNAIINYS